MKEDKRKRKERKKESKSKKKEKKTGKKRGLFNKNTFKENLRIIWESLSRFK